MLYLISVLNSAAAILYYFFLRGTLQFVPLRIGIVFLLILVPLLIIRGSIYKIEHNILAWVIFFPLLFTYYVLLAADLVYIIIKC